MRWIIACMGAALIAPSASRLPGQNPLPHMDWSLAAGPASLGGAGVVSSRGVFGTFGMDVWERGDWALDGRDWAFRKPVASCPNFPAICRPWAMTDFFSLALGVARRLPLGDSQSRPIRLMADFGLAGVGRNQSLEGAASAPVMQLGAEVQLVRFGGTSLTFAVHSLVVPVHGTVMWIVPATIGFRR